MAVTIKDIARKCNLSVATISRVANGLDKVKPETREMVLAAMKEFQYIPNAIARSMVSKHTKSVGIVIPDITNPFFPQVIKGAESVARQYGYITILCNSDESLREEISLLKSLRERCIDGLIITPAEEDFSHLQKLLSDKIPMVLLDRYIDGCDCDAVILNNFDGAYEAIKHLIVSGHTRIGIISGPLKVLPGRDRFEGYRNALCDYGIQYEPGDFREGNFKENSGYFLGKDILEMDEPPTAIFSCNNLMTVGLLKAIRDRGLQVGNSLQGQGMSIIGFDDIDIATFNNPQITVVSRPMEKMGTMAMELLMERIQGKGPQEGRKVVMQPQLVVRGST